MTYFKPGHQVELIGLSYTGRVLLVANGKVVVLWDGGLLKHPPEDLRLKPQWWSRDTPERKVLRSMELSNGSLDPVFQTEAGWFFCDETWSQSFGPLQTEGAIRAQLKSYCHFLDHGPVPCEPSCPLQPTQGPVPVSTG